MIDDASIRIQSFQVRANFERTPLVHSALIRELTTRIVIFTLAPAATTRSLYAVVAPIGW